MSLLLHVDGRVRWVYSLGRCDRTCSSGRDESRSAGGGRGDGAYSGRRDGSCLGGSGDGLCEGDGRRCCAHACHRG